MGSAIKGLDSQGERGAAGDEDLSASCIFWTPSMRYTAKKEELKIAIGCLEVAAIVNPLSDGE
jgi:hypothetical protein